MEISAASSSTRLGPVLDAAALASAGLGTAARVGEASTALRAGKIGEETVTSRAARATKLDDGTPVSRAFPWLPEWKSLRKQVSPKNVQENPWAGYFPVTKMPDGEIRVGAPGFAHEDTVTWEDFQKYGIDPIKGLNGVDPWTALEQKGFVEGTGVIDPETGKVSHVNIGNHFAHNPEGGGDPITGLVGKGTDDRFGTDNPVLAEKMADAARHAFDERRGTVTKSVTTVGGEYKVHEHTPRDTAYDTIHGMNDKGIPTTTDGHPMVNPTPQEIAENPWMAKHVVSTSPSGHQIHFGGNEHDDLWQAMKDKGILDNHLDFTDTGEHQVAATLIHDPETGKPVAANIGKSESMNPADVKALEAKILARAQELFVDKRGASKLAEPPRTRFSVRDNSGRIVAMNMPSKEAAIKHAQSLISPYSSPLQAFIKGGGSRGRLLDRYEEVRGIDHQAEVQKIMGDVADVLSDTNLRMDRRTVKQVSKEAWSDVKKTLHEDVKRPGQLAAEHPGFMGAKGVSGAAAAGEIVLREASDLVRTGAIYLRPAYLPNNWVGNAFMNMAHQGVLAPINLAKSLVMDKYIGKRYTAAIDKSMGHNAASVVTAAKGRGYVGSVTNPLARNMGMVADQPFRRAAWLQEARRAGYSKLGQVRTLFDKANAGDEAALKQIGTIGQKAQEEIVKFGDMNGQEKSIIRNIIFVYSWVRGATRYSARFPLQHPIQANTLAHLSQDVGNPYLDKELGGRPFYLAGAIPVGHDKNGNPILINPFSLNPLGTAVDVGRAAAGTAKVIQHPKDFNKYVDSDIIGITNPLIQNYIGAREGGQALDTSLGRTIAPLRLAHDLQHPNTGSVFPTSRTEALGHFTLGSMFPRVADQAALTRSLEREQRNNPEARIGEDLKLLKKSLGSNVPDDLVQLYRQDLQDVQRLKDFQNSYASSHGQSGFRNLPAKNRVDAAIKFLSSEGQLSPSEASQTRREAAQITNDGDLNSFANSLFSSTGIGQYKSIWDDMLSEARNARLTRSRG
jgi:hypothetical protein